MTDGQRHVDNHPTAPGPRIVARHLSRAYEVGKGALLFRTLRPRWGRRREDEGKRRTKAALDGVSLSVGPGEHVGIIGPNGAGKSTLLKIIAGLAAPTSGSVEVQGNVTAIFTLGLGLREECTGRQNIYLDGELRGKTSTEMDETIDEIIAFADIGRFIDQPLRTYSTGMKARLAFALLIHVTPEILIIDEALSVGDNAFFAKAQGKLREICRRGKISLIVSHNMPSIVALCTRCLWMEDGRVVMDGEPAVVTQAYLEAVRKSDEADSAAIVEQEEDAGSFRLGCRIARLDVLGTDQPAGLGRVRSGDRLSVVMDIEAAPALRSPRLRFRLEGLDGLLLAQSDHDAPELGEAGESPRLSGYLVAMDPCVLQGGRYSIAVELLEGEDVLARRATSVEVAARDMPTGGRPLLRYPASVQAKLVT